MKTFPIPLPRLLRGILSILSTFFRRLDIMKTYATLLTGLLLCVLITQHAFAKRLDVKFTKVADVKILYPHIKRNIMLHFKPADMAHGKIAFYTISKEKRSAVHANVDGYLTTIADAHTPVPDYPKIKFHSFDTTVSPSIWNNQVIFSGRSYKEQYMIIGIYRYANKKLTAVIANKQVADKREAVKNPLEDITYPSFFGTKGDIIFIGSDEKHLGSIYQITPKKKIAVLVDPTTRVPHTKDSYFTRITGLATALVYHNYNFVFLGHGKDTRMSGLYLFHKHRIRLIAGPHTIIPKGVGTFKKITDPTFDSTTNHVSFVGHGLLGQEGIYLYRNKKLSVVANQQTVIPDETDKFIHLYTPVMVDNKILFRGVGQHYRGIYLYQNGKIYTLISNRDEINLKLAKSFGLSRGAYDGQQAAILIHFKKAGSAIYIVDIRGFMSEKRPSRVRG